jgi:predicted PurR-regulated permease PerM
LLHPIAESLSKVPQLSWRMSVNLVFVVLVIVLVSLFTATGFAVVQQFQSLVRVIDRFVTGLPEMLTNLSQQSFVVGPYQVDMSQYLIEENLTSIAEQVLSVVQPLLGQAGGLLATVASQTASTLGWAIFVVLVSYFLLADMTRMPKNLLAVEIPQYDADLRRLGQELSLIWDSFLRGQVILFTLTLLIFSMVLSALGTRYFLALALLAGLARFVPYFGPFVTWTVVALVAYFQAGNYLGLVPWQYALIVVVFVVIIDQFFDNFVSPRFLGNTLGVHPAAVLVAAIIAANLLGLIGVVLAAPVLASIILVGRYTLRKMLDMDPWPQEPLTLEPVAYPWVRWGLRVQGLLEKVKRFRKMK